MANFTLRVTDDYLAKIHQTAIIRHQKTGRRTRKVLITPVILEAIEAGMPFVRAKYGDVDMRNFGAEFHLLAKRVVAEIPGALSEYVDSLSSPVPQATQAA